MGPPGGRRLLRCRHGPTRVRLLPGLLAVNPLALGPARLPVIATVTSTGHRGSKAGWRHCWGCATAAGFTMGSLMLQELPRLDECLLHRAVTVQCGSASCIVHFPKRRTAWCTQQWLRCRRLAGGFQGQRPGCWPHHLNGWLSLNWAHLAACLVGGGRRRWQRRRNGKKMHVTPHMGAAKLRSSRRAGRVQQRQRRIAAALSSETDALVDACGAIPVQCSA